MVMNKFLNQLKEDVGRIVEEEQTKDLAKEDALSMIAEFVKDVKKKFKKQADQLEILKAAEKSLGFYVDQIADTDLHQSDDDTALSTTSTSTMSTGSDEFDTVDNGTSSEIEADIE